MLVFDITSCGAHHSLCGATASGGPLNVFYPGTLHRSNGDLRGKLRSVSCELV